MHAKPLVEHTINSTRTNITWDKYKTPISILKPRDLSTDNDVSTEGKLGSISQRPTIDPESDDLARTWTRLAQSLDSESKPTRLPSIRSFRRHKHPTMV